MGIIFDKILDSVREEDLNAEKLRGVDLDAAVASPSDGKILVYRSAGSDWVLEDKPAGGSSPAVNDLTDATITSVGDNEVFAYDLGSGEWINQTAAEAGLAAASHTHTESDITDLTHYTSSDFDTDLAMKTLDDISAGTTNKHFTATDETKLDGIEDGAEVNNISDVNATDLTDSGDSSLHYHSTDRSRANHTGTQTASTISDFDTEVANNSDVSANTSARHASGSDNQNLYSSMTDGITTSTAESETDTFKFRSANNRLSVAVGSNDATHGDNLLLTLNEGNLSITESQISDLSHYTSTDFDTDFATKTQDDLGDGATYVRTENNFTDTLKTKLDGVEALADVTDSTNVNAAGAVMNSDTSTSAMNFVVDEDNMASDSATKVPTQQSVKAYVDANVGGGITWNEVTSTSQSASVDNGYITNNAGVVTVTLPDTAALGSVVRVAGSGAGGWKIAQNAGETIHFGRLDTTTGTGGYLQSTNQYDAVELVCITANTDWVVVSSVGNITVN